MTRVDAWENYGILAPLYLRPSQLDIYELIVQAKNPFIEAARRFGKTTTILAYVMEKLRQNPGWSARWCEPWKLQCREIVMPELEKLQAEFPTELKFKYQTTDTVYNFSNGSKLYLRGVNEDRGESARGPTSNIIIADEFGSWKDPEYIVNEVLRPQLLTTNGQFIFASSPAEDLSHAYYEHKDKALRENRFIQKTIYDNESLSPEKIQEIIQEVGGEHKAAWQREYLCKPVSDPERLIIPEYEPTAHDCGDERPRPEYCNKFVGADFGFNDHTALLFGYWDYRTRKLIIEQEHLVAGANTQSIIQEARKIETSLWGELANPKARVADAPKQQIYDILSVHNYAIQPARKDDMLAAINSLRLRFTQNQIEIHKRCESLRYQLKVGLWNERRTEFQRGKNTGHLDAIAALVYLNRTVTLYEHENPFPQHPKGTSADTHWINPAPSPGDQEALRRAFRPFSRG